MDEDLVESKKQSFMSPWNFHFNHSAIWEMRSESRRFIFRELTGEYAHILFGNNGDLETRCLSKPEEWSTGSKANAEDASDVDDESKLHSHHGRPCGRKLERGEPTHRCLTCGLDDTCVLCKFCFNPSDHVGHNVFVKISCRDDGGICDCGDPEAWTREIHCYCDQGPESYEKLPEPFKKRMAAVLGVLLDYTVDVLSGCSLEFQTQRTEQVIRQRTEHAALVPEKYHIDPSEVQSRSDTWCLQIWDDDKRSVTDMRASLLSSTGRGSAFINMITERIQKVGKATIAISDSFATLVNTRRHIKHFVTTIRSVEDVMREEMVVEIVDIIGELARARIPKTDASEMSSIIGESLLGRWIPGVKPNNLPIRGSESRQSTPQYRSEMDWYSPPVDPSMQVSKGPESDMPDVAWGDYNASGGTPSVGRSEIRPFGLDRTGNNEAGQDTPEFAGTEDDVQMDDGAEINQMSVQNPNSPAVIGMPTNNLPATVPTNAQPQGDANAGNNPGPGGFHTLPGPVLDDPLENEESFGPEYAYGYLSQQLQRDLSSAVPDTLPNWPIETCQARLKLSIFFDVRLHKEIRHQLTDLYVSVLLSSHSSKTRAAAVYADVYPQLVDQYIHSDKDPDSSVTTALSTQLFTTPSIATMSMESDAFGVYLNSSRRVFTKKNVLDPKVFRYRRSGQIFHEFGYLLWRNLHKEAVGANPWRVGQAAQFLASFQGLAPMRRRADKHIEYENEKWVYCYASMPYALMLARSIAAGIDGAPPEMQLDALTNGVQVISRSLMRWQEAVADKFDAQSMEIKLCYGKFSDMIVYSRGINVGSDPVSLLNPVHAFSSWMIEYASITNESILRLASHISDNENSYQLFEAPMCTSAVVAHISVGYWVRNGYAMRVQSQSYRDATLRDLAYARDIYMTQIGLSLLDPNTMLMSLIRHFGSINWPMSTMGDPQQAFYLSDEFIHTLNTLLTDRLRFQGLRGTESKHATLAREIIQVLGFKSMPYSELTRLVPESSVMDEQFDTVLAEYAVYSPPRGAHGVGMYALKTEHYSQFDPFYTHFTISKCEEAEKEAEAKSGSDHMGPLVPLKEPWSGLSRFTKTPTFGQLILRILVKLRSVTKDKPGQLGEHAQAEASFGRLLYLLIMAAESDLINRDSNQKSSSSSSNNISCFETFSELMKSPPNLGQLNDGNSILHLLYEVYKNEEFPSVHMRIEKLIGLLHQSDPEIQLIAHNPQEISQKTAIARDEHKQRGKEVQRRVLAESAKQQQQFLQNNSNANAEFDLAGNEIESDVPVDEDSTEGYVFSKHCVLCQMPDDQDSIFGILTYTSELQILRDLPTDDPDWISGAYSESPSLDIEHPPSKPVSGTFHSKVSTDNDSTSHETHSTDAINVDTAASKTSSRFRKNKYPWGPSFPKTSIRKSTLVQGCGHGVHQSCSDEFLRIQQQRRALTRVTPDHCRDGEFLCPLCKGLNNSFMPVLWNTNDVDADTFLKDAEDPAQDMRAAFDGTKQPERIDTSIESAMSCLNPKFLTAIKQHDFTDNFHINVRNALLEQMSCIKKKSKNVDDSDKNYGLRTVYRSFGDSIVHLEVALRGKAHSTPFGGLVMDQLPSRVTQFLRVFAKYITTSTGFISSSFSHVGKEPEGYRDSNSSPSDTFTKAIEMFFMGRVVNGVTPKTLLRQVIATEVGRVLCVAQQVDTENFIAMASKEEYAHLQDFGSKLDPQISEFFARFTPQNPQIVYIMLKYHITVVMRQYALVIYALCGKYDPDDFVGIMNLPEHDRLSEYLGLPASDTMLTNISDTNTAEGIAFMNFFGSNVTETLSTEFSKLSYPGLYRLIPSPIRSDMMFNIPGQKVDPAVCSMCGEMFSIQSTTKAEKAGPCNEHVPTCGLSQGLFLLARSNVVSLLLPHDRGTFASAPYLDLHGEPDENMRRGRPHYLQSARYDALTRDIWLANGLPSLTARKLDQTQDTGGWETL